MKSYSLSKNTKAVQQFGSNDTAPVHVCFCRLPGCRIEVSKCVCVCVFVCLCVCVCAGHHTSSSCAVSNCFYLGAEIGGCIYKIPLHPQAWCRAEQSRAEEVAAINAGFTLFPRKSEGLSQIIHQCLREERVFMCLLCICTWKHSAASQAALHVAGTGSPLTAGKSWMMVLWDIDSQPYVLVSVNASASDLSTPQILSNQSQHYKHHNDMIKYDWFKINDNKWANTRLMDTEIKSVVRASDTLYSLSVSSGGECRMGSNGRFSSVPSVPYTPTCLSLCLWSCSHTLTNKLHRLHIRQAV